MPRTLWKKEEVGSNRTSKNELRARFPDEAAFDTPKPERLIERVLRIATAPGDIVLDSFAGQEPPAPLRTRWAAAGSWSNWATTVKPFWSRAWILDQFSGRTK
ncbi:DNA methyltransferase [Bradyrhizobium sp. JR4.3]|uniref:DNA methyltransferase n=1 Tax=Bradyrhizobium sp. JR4.3 TaxID=3156373 RepID=UPI00339802B5